jgi:superfamily II DNA/RNA helicase
VGLNMQCASVVLNMDLPWNPAVLEQRIGRVHRLGQKQPVRVVNFVAQGTIEEGMLGVLKFKKSLFAGVLDGGEREVFLGGSRLNKFMETVESATSAIPEPLIEDAEEALRFPVEPDRVPPPPEPRSGKGGRRSQATAPPAPLPVPLAAESESEELTKPQPRTEAAANGATRVKSLVQRDEKTGENYLRLPVPPPEVLDQALQAFGNFLKGLRG